MVIINTANDFMCCPLSKKIIKPGTLICLFNMKQYISFKKQIYNILCILPDDIVELIIKKTNYLKYINRFGNEKITNWTNCLNSKNYKYKKLLKKNYSYNKDCDSSDNDYNERDSSDND